MVYRYPPSSNLKDMLEALRIVPVSNATDDMLGGVTKHLLGRNPAPSGNVHWFCEKADSLTKEAAAFSLRLHAYNSDIVNKWKMVLHDCLCHCAPCVAEFEAGKIIWRSSYFAAFDDPTISQFFTSFEEWELQTILSDIEKAGAHASTTSNLPPKTLPSGDLFRMLSNRTVMSDPTVQTFLHCHLPALSIPVTGWPDQIPRLALVLLINEDSKVRAWAKSYFSGRGIISKASLSTSYSQAISIVIDALDEHTQIEELSHRPGGESNTPSRNQPFIRCAGQSELWSGLNDILRIISPEWFLAQSGASLRLRRIIMRHLEFPSPHFTEVFSCFNFLLKRIGKDLWTIEGLEYPMTILKSIKENPQYHKKLENVSLPDSGMVVTWCSEFLSTLRNSSAYDDIYATVIDFLAMSAQENDLKTSHSIIAYAMMNILFAEYSRPNDKTPPVHRAMIVSTIDKHADFIISVAYGPTRSHEWTRARSKARELVEAVLEANVKSIQNAIHGVANVLVRYKTYQKASSESKDRDRAISKKLPPLPVLSVQTNIWKLIYSTLQSCSNSHDLDGGALAKFICIVSQITHITPIRTSIYSWDLPEGDKVLKQINESLSVIQNGLSASISTYSDYGTSSNFLEVLQCENVGKAITLLLLSPVEDFQTAAKTLIGLAFDVDGRMECFRAIFTNLTTDTFSGIFSFLHTFRLYANVVPEACALSAMLVLCFADILDVLCEGSEGLLHNSHFLKVDSDDGPAARMLQFWKLLTQALSLIYKRTPTWAFHIDTPDMVIWMRDAIILARDILKQWRVIENAAAAYRKAPKEVSAHGKISAIGGQMVDSLQEFLPELLKWLRLTDFELLHQSFELLISVLELMKESQIAPSPMALTKLSKYLQPGPSASGEEKTRLDVGRLSQLSEVVQDWEKKPEDDDDDEIEFVAHKLPPAKPSKDDSKAKDHRPYILGKNKQIAPPTQPKITTSFGSSSRTKSSKFSDRDQQKLEAAIPQASFRRSQTAAASSSVVAKKPSHLPTAKEATGYSTGQSGVSDMDESEPESDDDDTNLTNLGKLPSPKRPKLPVKPPVPIPKPKRQIQLLDITYDNKFRQKRELKKSGVQPRLDCSELHKIILSWNYNHKDESSPPGPQLQFIRVPNQFKDYRHYFEVFQPLLLVECWAQIVSSKERPQDSYQCRIESRQYVNNWIDLDMVISEPVKRDWYLAETDIVLLKHDSHEDKCIMAKVRSYRAMMSGIQLTVRCFIPGTEVVDPGLTIKSLWKISKVFSLSTVEREYRALLSMQRSEIPEFVMRPRLQTSPNVNPQELTETMQKYKVNEPQATAILKALSTNGFSLIQGPPGTGKTSTICGLISRFIAKRPRPAIPISVPGQKKVSAEDMGPTARVLVCAPSNAAIDELAQRIRDSRIGSSLSVVRIGADQTISSSIRDISLDYLVDQKLDANPASKPSTDIGKEINAIRQELDKVKMDQKLKKDELEDGNPSTIRRMTLENEIKVLNLRRRTLNNELDKKQDDRKSEFRAQDSLRRNTRIQILNKADIICSTLAGAGHESLDSLEFDLVVIDEAAQAIELSSLIPLKNGATHCIMVGDPQQLPPTVISSEATKFGYNQSLFVRLQRSNQDAVHLLSIQYRMHPDISYLPSRVFYDGRLLDGPDMDKKTLQPWHKHDKFGTYKFLNVSWGCEDTGRTGHDYSNPAESNIAVELFNHLRKEYGTIDFDHRVGVVSMYKAQLNLLRRSFEERFGRDISQKIHFNTVDGFQGQEKDIIILSCVRSGPGLKNIGFTADVRRMNVALTRAKSSLFIIGNAATLERSNDKWRAIVEDARTRDKLVAMDHTYYSRAGPRPLPPSTAEPPSKRRKVTSPVKADNMPELFTPNNLKASMQASNSSSMSNIRSARECKPPTENPANSSERPLNGTTDVPPNITFDASSEKLQTSEQIARNMKGSADGVDEPLSASSLTTEISDQKKDNRNPPVTQKEQVVGSSSATPNNTARPRPPLQKRPKQPTNIFIPNKRPKQQK